MVTICFYQMCVFISKLINKVHSAHLNKVRKTHTLENVLLFKKYVEEGRKEGLGGGGGGHDPLFRPCPPYPHLTFDHSDAVLLPPSQMKVCSPSFAPPPKKKKNKHTKKNPTIILK